MMVIEKNGMIPQKPRLRTNFKWFIILKLFIILN